MNKEMYVTELHLHTKESSSCSEIIETLRSKKLKIKKETD